MWEYTAVYVPDEFYGDYLNYLNEAGLENWEFTGQTYDTGRATEYLMKRKKEA